MAQHRQAGHEVRSLVGIVLGIRAAHIGACVASPGPSIGVAGTDREKIKLTGTPRWPVTTLLRADRGASPSADGDGGRRPLERRTKPRYAVRCPKPLARLVFDIVK
jgi:hypothetical protein